MPRKSCSNSRNNLIINYAISEYGPDLAAILHFGSTVRGDDSDQSDIDIITILFKGELKEPAYQRKVLGSTLSTDWNVATIESLEAVLSDTFWQYRLQNARLLYCQPEVEEKLDNWLKNVIRMINTPEARHRRIRHLREWEAKMISMARQTGHQTAWLFLLEALHLHLCRITEEDDILPYSKRNLFLLAENSGGFSKIGRQLVSPLQHEYGTERAWNIFKECVRRGRRVLFGEDDSRHALQHMSYTSEDVRKDIGPKPDELCWAEDTIVSSLETWAIDLPSNEPEPLNRLFHLRREYLPKANRVRVYEHQVKISRFKMILPTGGCRKSTCVFCELPNIACEASDKMALLNDMAIDHVNEMAIYTDGSFFDDRELTHEERLAVLARLCDLNIKRLTIESLPVFVTEDKVGAFVRALGEISLEMGIGLQSYNSEIRERLLRVSITDDDIQRIWGFASKYGFKIRIYLLCGKPLLTSGEDEADLRESIIRLNEYADLISRITINLVIETKATTLTRISELGYYNWPCSCWLSLVYKRCYPLSIAPLEIGLVEKATCASIGGRAVCIACDGLGTARNSIIRSRLSSFPLAVVGDINSRIRFINERIRHFF